MDPLTILGVAGNIVQFVDIGLRIVTKSNRIYHSFDGTLAENNSLEIITNDLLIVQTKLQTSISSCPTAVTVYEDEQALRKILTASNSVASILLERLNIIKAKGRFRRWNSFRQALKSVCSEGEINSMAQQLCGFRDELQTRILVTLSLRASENDSSVRHDLKEIQLRCKSLSDDVQTLSSDLSLSNKIATSNLHIQSLIHARSGSSQLQTSIASIIDHDQTIVGDDDIHKAILKAFDYTSRQARHESIAEAHAKTFRWILTDKTGDDLPWDNFVQWLQGDSRLYWLKGKAASGKSTLMKFLSQQQTVTNALEHWAAKSSLTRANFFFWALGTPVQKSQLGLLMSLLHNVLSQNPWLTKASIPSLWDELSKLKRAELLSLHDSWKQWTLADLIHVFESVVQNAAPKIKLFLLVDGLDEYAGDPAEISAFFSKLTKHAHVKICVSGRPLVSFEYEFKGRPNLQLQDLTKRDIHSYVYECLINHRHFLVMYDQDQIKAESLVAQIVERSSGVFMWVVLVTKSLLEGLTNCDTIYDLERRLKELPKELDALYRSMLQSIQPAFYRSQASRLLQIFHQNTFTMSSLALSFADEEDRTLALSAHISPIDQNEANMRIDAMTTRLKGRCRGLIEVQNYGHDHIVPDMVDYPLRPDQVQYLHLTVKEFLEQPEIWDEIASWALETSFDPNLACLQGVILLVKKTFAFHGWGQHIASLLGDAMSFARLAENYDQGQHYRCLVEEIDKIGVSLYPHSIAHHWTKDFAGCSYKGSFVHERTESTFLQYAIEKGLARYVKSLGRECVQKLNVDSKIPFLDFASGSNAGFDMNWDFSGRAPQGDTICRRSKFHCIASGAKSFDYTDIDICPYPPMIRQLFELGLDPNEVRKAGSPWHTFVSSVESQVRTGSGNLQRIIAAMKLFIIYGAHLFLPIRASFTSSDRTKKSQQQLTAADEIIQMFQYLPSSLTHDLFDMIEAQRIRYEKESEHPLKKDSNLPLADRITKPNQKRKLVDKDHAMFARRSRLRVHR